MCGVISHLSHSCPVWEQNQSNQQTSRQASIVGANKQTSAAFLTPADRMDIHSSLTCDHLRSIDPRIDRIGSERLSRSLSFFRFGSCFRSIDETTSRDFDFDFDFDISLLTVGFLGERTGSLASRHRLCRRPWYHRKQQGYGERRKVAQGESSRRLRPLGGRGLTPRLWLRRELRQRGHAAGVRCACSRVRVCSCSRACCFRRELTRRRQTAQYGMVDTTPLSLSLSCCMKPRFGNPCFLFASHGTTVCSN